MFRSSRPGPAMAVTSASGRRCIAATAWTRSASGSLRARAEGDVSRSFSAPMRSHTSRLRSTSESTRSKPNGSLPAGAERQASINVLMASSFFMRSACSDASSETRPGRTNALARSIAWLSSMVWLSTRRKRPRRRGAARPLRLTDVGARTSARSGYSAENTRPSRRAGGSGFSQSQ